MAFHHPNRSHRKPKMGAKAYPLRKIVGYKMVPIEGTEYLVQHELLECGHTMRPREDFAGETNALRRRCLQCFRNEDHPMHARLDDLLDK